MQKTRLCHSEVTSVLSTKKKPKHLRPCIDSVFCLKIKIKKKLELYKTLLLVNNTVYVVNSQILVPSTQYMRSHDTKTPCLSALYCLRCHALFNRKTISCIIFFFGKISDYIKFDRYIEKKIVFGFTFKMFFCNSTSFANIPLQ